MMFIARLLRLGRRQLHTVISRETIKPSSPTPSHLYTYNLSSNDQLSVHAYIPLVMFYPNNANSSLIADDKAGVLKKSLSKSLTRYYPFAGTLHTPTTPYVDCNDNGVVFVEAKNDSLLDVFQNHEHDQNLGQLFADDMVCLNSPSNKSLFGVQINHFACGGVGLAVSMSHLIGDGSTLGHFFSHWASVARYGSTQHKEVLPLNPHIIHSLRTDSIQPQPQAIDQAYNNHVSRRFVFPNFRLTDLKKKVITLSPQTLAINNPTRIEVLTSLLYATAVKAATTISGCFKPSCLIMPVDIRKKFVQDLPETTMGNCFSDMIVTTNHKSETSLCVVIGEIKKNKLQLQLVQSLEQAAEFTKSTRLKMGNEDLENHVSKKSYLCTSLCGFPYNKIDFGWGKPLGTTIEFRCACMNTFFLMDTPNGDGIEVLVFLDKEEMEIFENDKEMLSFCQIYRS